MAKSTLTLRRKVGQKVIVGEQPDAVEVTLSAIADNEVTLTFRAPRNLPIDRLEVAQKKERQRQET